METRLKFKDAHIRPLAQARSPSQPSHLSHNLLHDTAPQPRQRPPDTDTAPMALDAAQSSVSSSSTLWAQGTYSAPTAPDAFSLFPPPSAYQLPKNGLFLPNLSLVGNRRRSLPRPKNLRRYVITILAAPPASRLSPRLLTMILIQGGSKGRRVQNRYDPHFFHAKSENIPVI